MLRQFALMNPMVEPLSFAWQGETLVVGVRQTVRELEGNLMHDGSVSHVYTFRGRLVLRLKVR